MTQRWKQITGREVKTQRETNLTKVLVPDSDKTFMKNGQIHTAWKEVPHVEVISEGTKIVDAGTCDARNSEAYHPRYICSMKNISSPDQLLFWGVAPRMQV